MLVLCSGVCPLCSSVVSCVLARGGGVKGVFTEWCWYVLVVRFWCAVLGCSVVRGGSRLARIPVPQ